MLQEGKIPLKQMKRRQVSKTNHEESNGNLVQKTGNVKTAWSQQQKGDARGGVKELKSTELIRSEKQRKPC